MADYDNLSQQTLETLRQIDEDIANLVKVRKEKQEKWRKTKIRLLEQANTKEEIKEEKKRYSTGEIAAEIKRLKGRRYYHLHKSRNEKE